ncbi:DUF4124 domain-containing protein [Acinetobacter johnsonii]|jgi:hypothetical protein|uniref:DUF4124 domain-containing protein n=1 Tax=Acinetobacter TaxID=469 RepID=UPI000DB5E897|nr:MULTISPECIES: DUF4124 domain-containing protein [Acinetobacter]MDH1241704.1 DUF4124 domain-containing protein [Acinetobacter johnsonii]MWC19093.1 DUF4124 domain-containing protein [Acinetobacter johnsonii]PZO83181.1 MAG: DUF4124 domain-containing protein [Acinetobacter johnsonii]QBK70899.1 DUF4124 domain-containing protein [Acinetobacter johnsonii]RZN87522.1 DUF4124 domain-containing protein [Acinetobacter johnsonii]
MSIQFARIAACLVGMGLAMSSTQSFAKTYYKWVDNQGSTHYTTTPPPKTAKKKGKVDTYGWKNSPQAASSEAPPPANMPNNIPAPPNAVPSTAPAAPAIELENQRREANEALERGQQARPAEVQSDR